jgi:hypothetical protein
MQMEGVLISTIVENITTRKDRSVKITLGTSELSPVLAARLFQFMNAVTVTYFCDKGVSQDEINLVDKVDPEVSGKTPSQRMRSVLFLNFKQNPEGFPDFDAYYRSKMENMIDHYKGKLQQPF